jgi:hypothetical protein
MTLKSLLPVLLFFGSTATAQVTLQTGAPSINIPLIQYADEASKLRLDISLSYTGGNGIKIDEKASEVGLGWTLNAGGMVQRIQAGEPDDQKEISIYQFGGPNIGNISGIKDINIPAGLFNQPESFLNPSTSDNLFIKNAWLPFGGNTSKYYDKNVHFDIEHDKFAYSFNGEAGAFMLGRNSHTAVEEVLSGKKISVIEVAPNGNLAGSLQGFIIIDEDGIRYTFQKMLLNNILDYKESVNYKSVANNGSGITVLIEPPPGAYGSLPPILSANIITPIYEYTPNPQGGLTTNNVKILTPVETGYKIADAWYLTKIENTAINKKITFNYIGKTFSETNGLNAMYSSTDLLKDNQITIENTSTAMTVFEEFQNIDYQELSTIDLPDGMRIVFSYNSERKDQIGKKALDEIQYYNNDQLLYKYSLKYGYFFESSIIDAVNIPTYATDKHVSLALKSITKLGNDDSKEPATFFEYYTGETGGAYRFPRRNSFSKDYFGFNNGNFNLSVIYAQANQTQKQLISISELHGYTQYPNLYRLPTNDINIAQIGLLKSITNKYDGKSVYTYGLNKALSNNIEVLSGGVRVEAIKKYKNENEYTEQKFFYKNSNGLSSTDIFEVPDMTMNSKGVFWRPNKKVFENMNSVLQPNIVAGSYLNKISLGLTIYKGLDKELGGILRSSAIVGKLGLVVKFAQLLINTGLFSNTADILKYTNTYSFQTNMRVANNYVTPNYSSAQVYEYGNDANNNIIPNGYTNYEFVSILNKSSIYTPPAFPYSNKQRKLSFLCNQPMKITKFDKLGNKISEKSFMYEDKIIVAPSEYTSEKFGTKKYLSSPPASSVYSENFSSASGYINDGTNFVFEFYDFKTGKSYLTQTIERQYKGNNFLETKTDYTYIPNSHLQRSVKTTDSKGDITESKVFYSTDYSTPVEKNLVSKNIITPIATELWKTKAGSADPKLLSTSVIEYGTIANGDLKPVKSYSLKADLPVPQSAIGQFNAAMPIRDANLITLNEQILYDSKGNKVQENTVPNNTVNAVMYNIENVPIATVTNANRNEIAYTSFENVGGFESGFEVFMDDVIVGDNPAHQFYWNEPSPTGNRHVELYAPEDMIRTTIPITKESVLSFWATSSSVKINGVIAPFSFVGPTLNGWTYYEVIITANSPQQVITGKTKIDEVRLYPRNAKMITTTYDLAHNKTSECDINNRITYFESDKLGRPTKVMDEKRNTIKTFEYHFKN